MTLPGVDLILPCFTVALTITQVLPTDVTNRRDTFCNLFPKCVGYWPSEPNIINLKRVG